MIVLDTNVLSEMLRPTPDAAVKRWVEAQPREMLFTTVVCEAEIFYGLALLPAGRRRTGLAAAVTEIFDETFAGRILPFDSAAARAYAEIAAARRKSGRVLDGFDGQIAAIARTHGAEIATRNILDFAGCGIGVVNPWA